jgi:rare lipoprotein A
MRRHAGILAMSLGITATVVASPMVKSGEKAVRGTSAAVRSTHHWFQIGKASWYGPHFNGHKTANGEKYDQEALTCAHRTLPMGSWIRVTNLHNQKTVFLRVNDRGPMSPSLIVDLSHGAALRLGVDGLAKVTIEQVDPNDPAVAEEMVAQLQLSSSPIFPSALSPIVLGR